MDNNAKHKPQAFMSKPAGLPLIELPVGPNPDWELEYSGDEEEKEEKQSIPDRYVTSLALCNVPLTRHSCVILHSLRRCRSPSSCTFS